jgi:ribosome assembly protein YihI (activator of Der GTPase)
MRLPVDDLTSVIKKLNFLLHNGHDEPPIDAHSEIHFLQNKSVCNNLLEAAKDGETYESKRQAMMVHRSVRINIWHTVVM